MKIARHAAQQVPGNWNLEKSPTRDGWISLYEPASAGTREVQVRLQGRQIFFNQSVPLQYGFPLAIKAPFLMMLFLVMDVPGHRIDLAKFLW